MITNVGVPVRIERGKYSSGDFTPYRDGYSGVNVVGNCPEDKMEFVSRNGFVHLSGSDLHLVLRSTDTGTRAYVSQHGSEISFPVKYEVPTSAQGKVYPENFRAGKISYNDRDKASRNGLVLIEGPHRNKSLAIMPDEKGTLTNFLEGY